MNYELEANSSLELMHDPNFDIIKIPAFIESMLKQTEKIIKEQQIDAKQAKSIIKRIEGMPQYQNYQKQKVKMDTLESLIQDFDNQNPDCQNNQKLTEARKTMVDHVDTLEENINDYFEILVQIDRANKNTNNFHKEDWEITEKLIQLDGERREKHDAILADLNIINQLVKKHIKPDPKKNITPDTKLFEDNEITNENRTAIGQWACDTVIGEKLKKIIGEAQNIIERN